MSTPRKYWLRGWALWRSVEYTVSMALYRRQVQDLEGDCWDCNRRPGVIQYDHLFDVAHRCFFNGTQQLRRGGAVYEHEILSRMCMSVPASAQVKRKVHAIQ